MALTDGKCLVFDRYLVYVMLYQIIGSSCTNCDRSSKLKQVDFTSRKGHPVTRKKYDCQQNVDTETKLQSTSTWRITKITIHSVLLYNTSIDNST